MWRRYLRATSIAVIILLPILAFFFLNFCGERKLKRLNVYGPKAVNAPGDTTFHQLPPFEFTTRYGEPFNLDSLRGKLHVADFIFTNCPGICPNMSAAMAELQKSFQEGFPEVRFVSYTIDPERDTLAALKRYAKRYGAFDQWKFVRGEAPDSVYALAMKGYLVSAGQEPGAPEDGFFHDNKLVLVDDSLRIRGFYRAVRDEFGFPETKRLKEELQVLVFQLRERRMRAQQGS